MEYLYGNLSCDVWKLSQIHHCLDLGRKTLIKVFLVGLNSVLKVDLF